MHATEYGVPVPAVGAGMSCFIQSPCDAFPFSKDAYAYCSASYPVVLHDALPGSMQTLCTQLACADVWSEHGSLAGSPAAEGAAVTCSCHISSTGDMLTMLTVPSHPS